MIPTQYSRRRTIITPTVYNKRNTIVSMALVFGSIFLLVPWQVAFLGCWIFQLFTCATFRAMSSLSSNSPSNIQMTPTTPELLNKNDDDFDFDARTPTSSSQFSSQPRHVDESYKNANEHLLLLMTWLLPLVAPVLAVWVRTLMTAGYTTPFDGDHNVLYVAPFLVLVEVGAGPAGFMVSK